MGARKNLFPGYPEVGQKPCMEERKKEKKKEKKVSVNNGRYACECCPAYLFLDQIGTRENKM